LEESALSSHPSSADRSSARSAKNSKSWAAELEEYSLRSGERGEGGGGVGGGNYKSPSGMSLEEYSITSEYSAGGGGGGRGEEGGRGRRREGGDGAGKPDSSSRPVSSLSSLEEYPITDSRSFLDVTGSRENLKAQEDGSSSSGPDSARDRLELRDLMTDLLASGDYFSDPAEEGGGGGSGSNGEAASSSRLPPPPTRQPVVITEYEPHELSTILEVDTPQTATKTATALSRLSPTGDGGDRDRPPSKRYIDFGRHASAVSEDDKFSASGSSASSDVRSVIEVRPGAVRTGLGSSSGSEGRGGGRAEGSGSERGGGGARERGDELESTRPFTVSGLGAQQEPYSTTTTTRPVTVSGIAALSDTGDYRRSPLDVHASTSSSLLGYQPLEMTADSLSSHSVSLLDESKATPREVSKLESEGIGDSDSPSWAKDSEGGAVGGSWSKGDDSLASMKEGGDSGGGMRRGKVDEVLRQARRFNQDMMHAIHLQAADVFDQSSLSSANLSVPPADLTEEFFQ
jgi:hypothetical protein